MYRAFTEGFTGRWGEAMRSGTAGDLCPADIFGPDAAGGAEALQVTPPTWGILFLRRVIWLQLCDQVLYMLARLACVARVHA